MFSWLGTLVASGPSFYKTSGKTSGGVHANRFFPGARLRGRTRFGFARSLGVTLDGRRSVRSQLIEENVFVGAVHRDVNVLRCDISEAPVGAGMVGFARRRASGLGMLGPDFRRPVQGVDI